MRNVQLSKPIQQDKERRMEIKFVSLFGQQNETVAKQEDKREGLRSKCDVSAPQSVPCLFVLFLLPVYHCFTFMCSQLCHLTLNLATKLGALEQDTSAYLMAVGCSGGLYVHSRKAFIYKLSAPFYLGVL